MKKERTILVAVDFSKCSIKALEFAIAIANKVKAGILMVYVDKPQTAESVYSKRGKEHREKLIQHFEEVIKKFKPSLKGGKLEYKIRKGKIYSEVANQAKYSDAYLLVAGTHGVSGFEEFWIGSNSYRFVTSSICPVITVRENFFPRQKGIKKIVLPIDSTIETRQKVPFATGLAKYFDAEIHVLGVYTTQIKDIKNLVEGYVKQSVKYIEDYGVSCLKHFKFCENVAEETIKYADDINADLVAIMTEQETKTKNLWLGAYAQQMVNHSPVPVLTIQSRDLYSAHSRK